ncbi:DNA repair protein RecN [Nostocoides vanveenii]|uniref:DNA repair protein RecN n=1 Tax=Nostocoides vanveenii TaxID=330835 RepID=A0ABN2KMC2_9MICO
MISELRIGALGVIDQAVLALHPGLNVVSGETGAGKTMVVTGLGLLFGARGDSGLVRAPADAASVEGLIDVATGHPALARAADAGADTADGLILVRTVGARGRSRAYAGGRSVPVSVLGELAQDLLVVHGQADQWRLRSGEAQRALLDDFGGPDLRAVRERYVADLDAWRSACAQLERLTDLVASRTADLDVLRAGVERIERIDPQPGEDAALRAEEDRLAHAEQLRSAAYAAGAHLLGDDASGPEAPGAAELLAAAASALSPVIDHDQALADLHVRLQEVAMLVSDLGSDLSAYADGVDVDDERLGAILARRSELATLTRAHGGDLNAVLTWLGQASARLLDVDTAADELPLAQERADAALAALGVSAAALTRARSLAGADLAQQVSAELRHLAMGAAEVDVTVSSRGEGATAYGPVGADDVEFVMRAGSGLPARPIAKAASGGELSRVMLAIEVVLGTRAAVVPTYVFDEVDAGVGGRAALDIGARLARLAINAQVLVVTHLPQVAAFADAHLVVTKADDGQVTRSDVRLVAGEARERELARMMAGGDSEVALDHARELLASAAARRASWDN